MRSRGALTAAIVIATQFAALPFPLFASVRTAPSMSAPRYKPTEESRKSIDALRAERYYLAGLARAGDGNFKGAVKFFEKAIKYNGAMVPARQQLGITFAKWGKLDKAQAELNMLNVRAKICATTCAEAADLRAAIAAIATAMGQSPQARADTMPTLFFTATGRVYQGAVSLINERRYNDAIVQLLHTQAAFGPQPDVLAHLGFAHHKLGRADVAEVYYRTALAAEPLHRAAIEYYGELLVERGDLANARIMLTRLDAVCTFGCAEAEELRRWIATGHAPAP